MSLNKSEIKKILVFSLTNIGDVVLTFPVIDILKNDFPDAELSLIVGPKVKTLLEGNPHIYHIYIHDKHLPKRQHLKWARSLRKEKFDLIVDLRNSIYPFFIGAKYKTSLLDLSRKKCHMRQKHLNRLKSVYKFEHESNIRYLTCVSEGNRKYVQGLLEKNSLSGKKFFICAPAAADHRKRWSSRKFAQLCDRLIDSYQIPVVFIGDKNDKKITSNVQSFMKNPSVNLTGKLDLIQLTELIKHCDYMVTNDSSPMHLASYLDKPVLAVFGPTNPYLYGPWSSNKIFIHQKHGCIGCKDSKYSDKHTCMSALSVEKVFQAIKVVDGKVHFYPPKEKRFKNILIVRTDRIGDVVLTTPSIRAIRQQFPESKITVMVSSLTYDLVYGSEDVDDIIMENQKKISKGKKSFFKLVGQLRSRKFDLAVVFHTKKWTNLVCFLAGIPNRLGYRDDKFGFLLTHQVVDTRSDGKKHEAQYCLDLLQNIGIYAEDLTLYVPVQLEAKVWCERFLEQYKITEDNQLIAFHLGASDPSKRWPEYRFAQLAEELSKRGQYSFAIIGGKEDCLIAEKFMQSAEFPVINLAGKTSIAQMAALLERCCLFVSNDSGPVHVAAAVGTPVISIFTRNQPGINPERWRPLGQKSRYISVPANDPRLQGLSYKKAGEIEPKYLEIIEVGQVLEEVDSLFKLC